MAPRTARKGDTVKVHYTGRLADKTIFDTTQNKPPLQFIIGKEEVIPGFEEAVTGMATGEKKSAVIPYPKAYGPRDKELIEVVPREILPPEVSLRVGGQLEITLEDGQILRAMVAKLTDETVTLDRNHPLAGRDLTFDIEVLEISKTQSPIPFPTTAPNVPPKSGGTSH